METNKVYNCDCLQMKNIIPKNSIDLIYIDPPFGIKADEKFGMIPWHKNTQESNEADEILPMRILSVGEQNYLRWIYPRLVLIKELLSNKGSFYIHLDWHIGHYVKIMLDEIFGKQNFLNEVVWYYRRWNIASSNFSRNHDTLFYYIKERGNHIFNQLYIPKSEKSSAQGKAWKSIIDENGVRKSIMTDEPTKGVPMPDTWEISMINPVGKERLNFPTQKPESLLERIIEASSNRNSIVADLFAGSGTMGAVAEKLGRKWIMCDISKPACEIIGKRLNCEIIEVIK